MQQGKSERELEIKTRSIKDGLEDMQNDKEKLCMKRIEKAFENKTPQWSVSDVMDVLKTLKTGKSKDPYEIPNELFKPDVAGTDLVVAITKLMNRIKNEMEFPSVMEKCNVTNIYKKQR